MEDKERILVEAIKLSVGRLDTAGISAKEVLEESIKYLYDLYCRTQQVEYLLRAKLHIQAYMELGFLYDNCRDLFGTIEELLKKEGCEAFQRNSHRIRKILANKSQVRSVLGRWSPKHHSMPINEVVKDIIVKVQKNQIGCYNYWTEQKYGRESIRFEYELYIRKEEALLYDTYKNYYYTLERGKNVENSISGR